MTESNYEPIKSTIKNPISVDGIRNNYMFTDDRIGVLLKIHGKDDIIVNLRHYIKSNDVDKLLDSMRYVNSIYGNMDDIKYELSSISINGIDLSPKYLFIHTKPCGYDYDITMFRFSNDESKIPSPFYDPDEIVFRIEMDNQIYEEFYHILNYLYTRIETITTNFHTSYTYHAYDIHKVSGYIELMPIFEFNKISCHIDTIDSLISDIIDNMEEESIYFITYEPMVSTINGIYKYNSQLYYPITNPNSLFINGKDLKDIYDAIMKVKKEGK